MSDTLNPDDNQHAKSKKNVHVVAKHIADKFRWLFATKKRKVITIVCLVIGLAGVLSAIPYTRYAIAGLVVKKDVSVTIVDSVTKRPVSDATVSLGGIVAKSNGDGVVKLKSVSVGQYDLSVNKPYYSEYKQPYTVPLLTAPAQISASVVATGRQVTITVLNKITNKPIDGLKVSASDTSSYTNKAGQAVIILPATKNIQKATLSMDGFNTTDVELDTLDSNKNTFAITAAGSITYLSKATGTINVMKSNIDGTGAETVVEGTGQESDYTTVLLSSRDWKYSVLQASRSDDKLRIYLVTTQNKEITTIDEGDVTFELVGWSGHNFIYTVTRSGTNNWDNKKQAIKSYNADTKKLTILDETIGSGNNDYDFKYQLISSPYILDNEIVYMKNWQLGQNYQFVDPNVKTDLVSINATTYQKKTVKQFAKPYGSSYEYAKLYKPQELYIRTQVSGEPALFYEYHDGVVKQVTDVNDAKFYGFYPTYLMSPSGNKTFWYEPRDGKNALFVGNTSADSAKQIAALSEYTPYGWYGNSDEYILLSKGGSELYIAPADVAFSESYVPLKLTNYHKPTASYPGYGYGYGGQ